MDKTHTDDCADRGFDFCSCPEEELIARHHVRPEDLNSGNFVFGGRMLSWIDDAAASYAMTVLKTTSVVTARISEVNFLAPGRQGDMIEFYASIGKVGKTTLTVHLRVVTNTYTNQGVLIKELVTCDLVFVAIGENGRPKAHGFTA